MLSLVLQLFGVVRLCYSLSRGGSASIRRPPLSRSWTCAAARRRDCGLSAVNSPHPFLALSLSLASAVSVSDHNDITTNSSSCCVSSLEGETKISRSIPFLRPRVHTLSSLHAVLWDVKFNELVAFHEKYGRHVNVPQYPTFEIPDDYQELSTFCRNVRCQYRYLHNERTRRLSFLTQERIERLESIGFVWNSQEDKWQSRYEELLAFRRRFGHVHVPHKWEESPSLASWVSYQRLRYKSFISQRQQRSNNNNIKTGPPPTTTNTGTHPTSKWQGGDSSSGGHRPLTERQVYLLEDIGFQWGPKNEKWWEMYKDLKEFWTSTGHCKVPRNYDANPHLYSWLASVRKYCRDYVLCVTMDGTTEGVHVSGLNEARLQALRDLDFCWLPPASGGILTETPPVDIFATRNGRVVEDAHTRRHQGGQ
jgi:Helicase associated domain